MVRMVHPKHGTTHAVGAEVQWNIAHGWRVEMEAKPATVVAVEPAAPVADIREQYIAKFGKPPHHRMTEATIRAKLTE